MRRGLLNAATIGSLLICAGAAAVSVRSNFAADHFHWRSERTWADFISARGRFLYWQIDAVGQERFGGLGGDGFEHRSRPPHNNPGQRLPTEVFAVYRYDPTSLGFDYRRAAQPGLSLMYFGMPWWPVMLASAVLPMRWCVVRELKRARRVRQAKGRGNDGSPMDTAGKPAG